MTDRSITECYFSNPTEIGHFESLNSYTSIIKIEEDNDYLLESAKTEEQENITCIITPSDNSLAFKDNDSNCESIIQNFKRSKNFCGQWKECNRFSSLKDSFSSSITPVFPVEYSNHDSFSQTENICNEEQPFGEEDSISFNDYSMRKGSHNPLDTLSKSETSNFLENNGSSNNPSLKIGLSAGDGTCLYDNRSNSEIDYLEKHLNYSKKTLQSELLLYNNKKNCDKDNKGKTYSFDGYETKVSSRYSIPNKDKKPIKALGVSRSNSKSLQDLSKVYDKDVNEVKPSHKKDGFSVDYLEIKTDFTAFEEDQISTGTSMNIKNPFINIQKNLNHSGCLEIAKNECRSLPANKNALNKAKSISLHSLQGIKKSDYSHIQSKVKLYIQNLKNIHKDKQRETVSLPSTPIRGSDNLENSSTMLLDEKLFDSLTSKRNLSNDELPDNLRMLKSKLLNSSDSLKFGTELFEALYEQVKSERRQRIQQDITLHKLQLDYNNLLAKYAQAENIIDKLRIFSGDAEMSSRIKKDPINYVSGINESITKPYCEKRQHFPKHLKKAFSTSNIFHDPRAYEDDIVEGSLVKYSSSSIIDPNINITIQMRAEPSEISMNLSKKSLSLDKVNSTSTTLPTSHDDNDAIAGSVCSKKYEVLSQKLREFAMLEGNFALQPSERDIIWNYLKKLYNEFFEDSMSMSPSSYQKQMLQNIYDGIIFLSSKYSLSTSGLSVTDVQIPKTTFSAINTEHFKECQENIRSTQRASHRRMSLPAERLAFHSIYDRSILYEDHWRSSPVENELAQENQNGSFIDSCQEEGPVNNPCLFTSSTPSSYQQTEDRQLEQANNKNKYLCETSKPFFKQESKKSVGSTSLKNRIAQYKAKDNDSGCPPSDRSTRNSPAFSFSQYQTNAIENGEENFKCHADYGPSSALPITPLKSKKYFNLVTSSKNDADINDISWQTGYDASSSSADDESFFMSNAIRNKLEKQSNNLQEDSSHIAKKLDGKSIKKYEDKYVYGNCSSFDIQDLTSPHSSLLRTRNCISPIAQLEKKSSLLNSQIDGLKGKHWKHRHNKGPTIPTSRLQPIKPVCESSIWPVSNNSNQVKDNFKLQRHADIIDDNCLSTSEEDIVIRCQRIISKGGKNMPSLKKKSVSKANANSSKNLCIKTSKPSSCNDSSSTQKKSNLAKAKSLNFSDFKFDAPTERSKSISSITKPIIYIEHYNCCDNNHLTHCKHKMCDSNDSHISDASLSNAISKLNKHVNFVGSLNEATSLAEKIQKTSMTLLQRIREDSSLKK